MRCSKDLMQPKKIKKINEYFLKKDANGIKKKNSKSVIKKKMCMYVCVCVYIYIYISVTQNYIYNFV